MNNQDWISVKFKEVDREIKEIKEREIKEIKERVFSPCSQKDTIELIRERQVAMIEELGNWKFFKRLFFVLIGMIVTITIFAITSFIESTTAITENTNKIQNTVNELTTRHDKMVNRVEYLTQAQINYDDDMLKEHIKEIRKVMKEELENIPTRRR